MLAGAALLLEQAQPRRICRKRIDRRHLLLAATGQRPGSVFRDVLDGLANLGYAEDECAPMVKKLLLEEPDLDVTGALRAALKTLARGRS